MHSAEQSIKPDSHMAAMHFWTTIRDGFQLFIYRNSSAILKAAFHLRVFHTCVYARKSLNLSKFFSTTKYLNEYTLNCTENCHFIQLVIQ